MTMASLKMHVNQSPGLFRQLIANGAVKALITMLRSRNRFYPVRGTSLACRNSKTKDSNTERQVYCLLEGARHKQTCNLGCERIWYCTYTILRAKQRVVFLSLATY